MWPIIVKVESSHRPCWRSLSSSTTICAVHKNLEFTCVTVECIASPFLNVHPKAEVVGDHLRWMWVPKFFGPKTPVGVQQVQHCLCWVCQRSALLEVEINFLVSFLTHGRTFVSKISLDTVEVSLQSRLNKTRGIFSFSPCSMLRCQAKHHDWGWLLGCWYSAYSETSFLNGAWFFRSLNKRVLFSRRLWTVDALNVGFLEHCRFFSFHLFDHPGHSGDWDLLLPCQSYPFLAWVVLKAFFDDLLAYNMRYSWLRTIL